MRRLPALLGLVLGLLACASAAQAAPNLFVGVVDDSMKWTAHPQPTASVMRDLGLRAVRVPLAWRPGNVRLSRTDATALSRVVYSTFGMRVVLSVNSALPREVPLTSMRRDQYCAYVRDALTRFPSINDVVISNEPNTNDFWMPQYNADGTSAAPGAYVELLARCWDVLHALRPKVNVISNTAPRGNDNPYATSNQGHSPGNFIRKTGEAYRLSGRTRPIFDTVGHHPYPDNSAETPFALHPRTNSIGQGDYDKLVAAVSEAFTGTDQPLPGTGRVTIWYMEDGFQTRVGAKRALYTGKESARPISDAQHALQLADAVRLAYCQPNVGAFFNFLLADERNLAGWQSGVLWVDGAKKPSYAAFRSVVREVNARAVDCVELAKRQAAILAGGFLPPAKP